MIWELWKASLLIMWCMTITLPLKHTKALIMSIYSLHLYYMPTNMLDYNKPRSSYTKLQISHPYLLLSDDQYALLDENMYHNTIQYDHMYVQTTPILLFGRTVRNCYVNIIEHSKGNLITSTCIYFLLLPKHKYTSNPLWQLIHIASISTYWKLHMGSIVVKQ